MLQQFTDPMRVVWAELETEAGVRGFLKVEGSLKNVLVREAGAANVSAKAKGAGAARSSARDDKAERSRLRKQQLRQHVRTARHLLAHTVQTGQLLLGTLDVLHALRCDSVDGDSNTVEQQLAQIHAIVERIHSRPWQDMLFQCSSSFDAALCDSVPTDHRVFCGSSWPLPVSLERGMDAKLAEVVELCHSSAMALETTALAACPAAVHAAATIRDHVSETSDKMKFVAPLAA